MANYYQSEQIVDEYFSFRRSESECECNDLLNDILYCTFQAVTCHQQEDIKLFFHPVVEVAERNDRNSQKEFSPHEIKYLSGKLVEVLSLRRNNASIEDVISTITETFVERALSNVRLSALTMRQSLRDETLILVRSIVLLSCKILSIIKFLNALNFICINFFW